jgi:hypothetical protein
LVIFVGRYAELGMTELLSSSGANDQQVRMDDVANSLPEFGECAGQEDGTSRTPPLTDPPIKRRAHRVCAPRLTWTEALQGEERMWSLLDPTITPRSLHAEAKGTL